MTHPRHDVDEDIDATLTGVLVVNTPVSVLHLPQATVRERVTGMGGIRPIVGQKGCVGQCQL